MVEPDARIGVVRNVRQDVVLRDANALVGDVLRMDERDLVDRLLHRDDDGARETVEVPPCD